MERWVAVVIEDRSLLFAQHPRRFLDKPALSTLPTLLKHVLLVSSRAHHPNRHPCPYPQQELGAAALSKRPTSCMLILPKAAKAGAAGTEAETKEFDEAYGEVEKKIKALET